MTSQSLESEITKAVPMLLQMARELTWNEISDNCRFIVSEIEHSAPNSDKSVKLEKKKQSKKDALTLPEIMPALLNMYNDLYDINLLIYKSTRSLTIIDIQYYLKSWLPESFRQTIAHLPPMLHCKIANPPWRKDENEKFDINWERKTFLRRWIMFWLRLRLSNYQNLK